MNFIFIVKVYCQFNFKLNFIFIVKLGFLYSMIFFSYRTYYSPAVLFIIHNYILFIMLVLYLFINIMIYSFIFYQQLEFINY